MRRMLFRLPLVLAALSVALIHDTTAQRSTFIPVTDAVLRNPAPGDWLRWRRDHGVTVDATSVTVLSPEEIIAKLISEIGQLDFKQASNLRGSALTSVTGENRDAACGKLAAFKTIKADGGMGLMDPALPLAIQQPELQPA